MAPPDLGICSREREFQRILFDNPDTSTRKPTSKPSSFPTPTIPKPIPSRTYHHVDGNSGWHKSGAAHSTQIFLACTEVTVGVFKTVAATPSTTVYADPLQLDRHGPPAVEPLQIQTSGIGEANDQRSAIFTATPTDAVNAVLIGGGDDDTLEYTATVKPCSSVGEATIACGRFNNSGQAVYVFGNTIDPSVFDVNTINLPCRLRLRDADSILMS